jgi:small subunit ribosomal protein S7
MRRTKPERRKIAPDVKYNSELLQHFINRVMKKGKKSTARRVVYDAFDIMESRANQNPLELFESAIANVGPVLEVKPRRVGGATYQVPMEVDPHRRMTLAMRWILAAARSRSGKSMAECLADELLDAANKTGTAIKKREETHRMAEANRAFAHYRF